MERRRPTHRRSTTSRSAANCSLVAIVVMLASSCGSHELGARMGWKPQPRTSHAAGWKLSPVRPGDSSDSQPISASLHSVSEGVDRSPAASSFAFAPEWSRAIEIGSVIGETIRRLSMSWLEHRRRNQWNERSGSGDVDFWTLRSGVAGGEAAGWTNAELVTLSLERLGCTFVKFGQAMASRPDLIPPELASALSKLQDRMEPFDTSLAIEIVRRELAPCEGHVESRARIGNASASFKNQQSLDHFLASLSPEPVAAASIGQVYRGFLDGYGPVAVKVRRPGIEKVVEQDAALLRSLASSVEEVSALWHASTPFPPLVRAKLVDAVDEFMSRIREELDYRREAENLKTFASLYSSSVQRRLGVSARRPKVQVVVPRLVEGMCTGNVLVMEWLNGTKLVDQGLSTHSLPSSESVAQEMELGLREEHLSLVSTGIECTLSQLLDTGILHADPHAGNLLKVPSKSCEGSSLGYIDFGLLSRVPSEVRDGLVCAVAQLVFSRNVDKVARLFGELQLLPQHVLQDPLERQALAAALDTVFDRVLDYSDVSAVPARDGRRSSRRIRSEIPGLRFENLLASLAGLVSRFEFQLPPYFLNNARALGTLEGIARSLDPGFNVLRVVYPYAINRLLTNPSGSSVVDETLLDLLRCPSTGTIKPTRIAMLLDDAAALTGYSRRRVAWDIIKTRGGRRLVRIVASGLAAEGRAKLRSASKSSLFTTYFKL